MGANSVDLEGRTGKVEGELCRCVLERGKPQLGTRTCNFMNVSCKMLFLFKGVSF